MLDQSPARGHPDRSPGDNAAAGIQIALGQHGDFRRYSVRKLSLNTEQSDSRPSRYSGAWALTIHPLEQHLKQTEVLTIDSRQSYESSTAVRRSYAVLTLPGRSAEFWFEDFPAVDSDGTINFGPSTFLISYVVSQADRILS